MRELLAPRLACLLSFETRDPAFAWLLSSLGEIRNFTRESPRPDSVAKAEVALPDVVARLSHDKDTRMFALLR